MSSIWVDTNMPYWRDLPDLGWLEWCRVWDRRHSGVCRGLFSNRIFYPDMVKPGRWKLSPLYCQACWATLPQVGYCYNVCPSCWAVGQVQVWRFLVSVFGDSIAHVIWAWCVWEVRGLPGIVLHMETTLLAHNVAVHPDLIDLLRHYFLIETM
jgi:hypothetical protein